jgi:hypothetical protein
MKVKDHLHINIIQKCLEAFLIIKKINPFLNIKSHVVETYMSHFIIMKHLIDVKQLYLELMNSNVKMFFCAYKYFKNFIHKSLYKISKKINSCEFFSKPWAIINIKWFSQFHYVDLQGKFNNLYQTIMHNEMSMIPFSMKRLV